MLNQWHCYGFSLGRSYVTEFKRLTVRTDEGTVIITLNGFVHKLLFFFHKSWHGIVFFGSSEAHTILVKAELQAEKKNHLNKFLNRLKRSH